MRSSLRTTLLVILALAIPATIGLLIIGQWMVRVLYGTAPEASLLITWAVQGYALGLIGHSMLEITARTFYAQQDTWTPLYVAVGAMLIAIIASFALQPVLGVGGLALANAIGVTVEVTTLLLILRRRLRLPAAVRPSLRPQSSPLMKTKQLRAALIASRQNCVVSFFHLTSPPG
jgi:putative peptidoglycan lipid II flippase